MGDCQIPVACQTFVQHKGKELLLKNLYKNFVLHMGSLFDFGLVSAVCLYTTIKTLQEMVGETAAIRTVLKQARDAQIDNWSKNGHTNLILDKPCTSKAPGRKTGIVGMQRRKGTPTPAETPISRRKSVGGETSRKRISLSLSKVDQKNSAS